MIENENVEEEKNQSTVTVNTSSPTDTNSKILPPSSSSSISEGISANSSNNIATTLKQDELKGITMFYRCRFLKAQIIILGHLFFNNNLVFWIDISL